MPDWRDLQHRLEYALLRLLVFVVRLFPLDLSAAISARIWQLVAPLDRRNQRALDNLAIAFPEMPLGERQRIVRAMWGNLGRVMAETMQLDRIIADPSRIEIADRHIFDRYRQRMGPTVGVSLHMGNWELAIWPLTVGGGEPAAVYRLVKNPYVDRYIRAQRRDLYPGGMLARGKAYGNRSEGQKTARIILDYVRQGGRLGIVADLHDRNGIEVPFFGRPARSTPAPAMIARRAGCRIWMARCIRLGEASRFKIEMKELKVRRTANQADDIKWITAELHREFEAWVKEYPEQWMWSNRRWG